MLNNEDINKEYIRYDIRYSFSQYSYGNQFFPLVNFYNIVIRDFLGKIHYVPASKGTESNFIFNGYNYPFSSIVSNNIMDIFSKTEERLNIQIPDMIKEEFEKFFLICKLNDFNLKL